MHLFKAFLLPFAGLYWLGLQWDRWRRSPGTALPKPVISIGNVTVGGTGKTPLLIYLATYLVSVSKTPAVLTRGYAGFGKTSGSAFENDEALLLKKRCPGAVVGIGADRAASARRVLEQGGVDVFLLDDGFQHWPLKRDLDIVCVDATDPWGGGWLLPAGRLREPRRALRRANAVVITRADLVSRPRLNELIFDIESFALGVPLFFAQNNHRLMAAASGDAARFETLREKTVVALSAIGNPRAFEDTLARFAARVEPRRFADHHAYSAADVARVVEPARAAQTPVVVTEKDWVKIESLNVDKTGLYVLQQEFSFSVDQQQRFEALLHPVLA